MTAATNDATGACAHPPGLLLKVVLFAYSQGIVSRRGIERAYRERVTFEADPDTKAAQRIARLQRDERFKEHAQYKALPDPLYDKAHPKKATRHFRPRDFDYDEQAGICIFPAGKKRHQNGANCIHNEWIGTKFQGAQRDCLPCALRDQCLRTPQKTTTRQVCFFRGEANPADE